MLKQWILATRPYSFPASLSPVLLGLGYSFRDQGSISFSMAITTIFSALFMQIAANLFNDYYDWKNKVDTKKREGFARLCSHPEVNPKLVFYFASITALLAFVLGLCLIYRGGWPIAAIGFSSLALAFFYTGGPFPLAYHRLGELIVILYFGPIAVAGSYFLQTLQLKHAVLLQGLAPGLIGASIMAINNLRDRQLDLEAGKRTLANGLPLSLARLLPCILVWAALFAAWNTTNLLLFILYIPICWKIISTQSAKILNLALVRTGQFLVLFTITQLLIILT